jgi:hypothetical protein
MKTEQKSPFSLIPVFIGAKSGKLFYLTSLLAITLGIFLLPKTAFMAAITPDRIISLTNTARNQTGLNTLQTNSQLTAAAKAKAQAILDSQTFDHTINGKKFSVWIKAAGYKYDLVGENLAIDFVTSEGLMRAWLASPEHRQNITEKEYTDIGVGIAEGKFAGQDTIVVAQLFGDPLIKTAPIPEEISRLNEKISPRIKNDSISSPYLSFYYQVIERLSSLTERRVARL